MSNNFEDTFQDQADEAKHNFKSDDYEVPPKDEADQAKQVMDKNLKDHSNWENRVRWAPRLERQGGLRQALKDRTLLIEANLRGASLPGGQDQKWNIKLEIMRKLVEAEKEAEVQRMILLESERYAALQKTATEKLNAPQKQHIQEVKPMGERVSKALRVIGTGAADLLGSQARDHTGGPGYKKLLRNIPRRRRQGIPTTREIQGLYSGDRIVRYR